MQKLRMTNTQFEWELEQQSTPDLIKSFFKHPIYLQLQFLSYLYAEKADVLLTTHRPDPDYIKRLQSIFPLCVESLLLEETSLPPLEIDTWGDALSVVSWAKKRSIAFAPPPWEVVKEVNSKAFSYENSPKLQGSRLIHNTEELATWIERETETKVIKSIYGLSGRGHAIFSTSPSERDKSLIKKELSMSRPLIAEPWVERVLDFSTQWRISKEQKIDYLGATLCKNNKRGSYAKTLILPGDSIGEEYDSYLYEHKKKSEEVLRKICAMGYFGHVGIDAMIYQNKGSIYLHPIVEINARKTMGYVALQLQRTHFQDQILTMSFSDTHKEKSLLPYFIESLEGKIIPFPKALHLDIFSKNKSWKDIYF